LSNSFCRRIALLVQEGNRKHDINIVIASAKIGNLRIGFPTHGFDWSTSFNSFTDNIPFDMIGKA
jgi:hypothetical protein